jgi:hypothetical protein
VDQICAISRAKIGKTSDGYDYERSKLLQSRFGANDGPLGGVVK